jgi:iron only hydrogenase large subunit-like protein
MTPERHIHVLRDPDASGRRPALIEPDGAACRGCWACARLCPAKAIKIVDGRPEIIHDRCVSCGACVVECSNAGYLVRDDTAAARLLLAGSRPVVAVLATEFVTALHPLTPTEVEVSLESMGFFAVESTLLGEEIVAESYERSCARLNGLPLIRSTCPVVVEWVRRYRPSLTGALAPIVPPYIAQARLVKELYAGDVAVVYAGPCFARKDEALDPQFEGAVDVALDFIELSRLIEDAGTAGAGIDGGMNRPVQLKEISLTDGFPRVPLEERSLISTDIHVSRGLYEADRILEAIEHGETAL